MSWSNPRRRIPRKTIPAEMLGHIRLWATRNKMPMQQALVAVVGRGLDGICRRCGCTDEDACSPPCSWIDRTLCSACTDAHRGRFEPPAPVTPESTNPTDNGLATGGPVDVGDWCHHVPRHATVEECDLAAALEEGA